MKFQTLVWSASFDRDGRPDEQDWEWEVGGGGWGNNEAQTYTDSTDNSWIEDGVLHLRARREADGAYTSARMTTYGRHSWQYGRVEIEAKLPAGKGTWPAIWMLPDDMRLGMDWPLCGEIDIMEHVGWDEGTVHCSLHSQMYNHMLGTQKTVNTHVECIAEEFHRYAVEWDETSVCFLVDDEEIACFVKGMNGDDTSENGWPFDRKYYLILNIALEGWGGPIDDTALPCEMQVRSVRVYQ